MRKLAPFTPEEQAFAEEHHYLVDKFLRIKRLSPADYYDVVIFGFLEAVQQHHRDPIALERQNFAAFAFICMEYAVGEDWKYKLRPMRRGDPFSLDAAMSDDNDGFSFYSLLSDTKQDPEKQVEIQALIARLLEVATPRELEAIELVCQGYTSREVSEILGVSPATGRKTLYHFRRKAKAVRDEQEVVRCPYYEKYRDKARTAQAAYRASKKVCALQAAI